MHTRTTKFKMAAISTSSSVSSSSVVNHYGTNSQIMSAPSAVTVQVLSSSPATPIVSCRGSVDNGKVGLYGVSNSIVREFLFLRCLIPTKLELLTPTRRAIL